MKQKNKKKMHEDKEKNYYYFAHVIWAMPYCVCAVCCVVVMYNVYSAATTKWVSAYPQITHTKHNTHYFHTIKLNTVLGALSNILKYDISLSATNTATAMKKKNSSSSSKMILFHHNFSTLFSCFLHRHICLHGCLSVCVCVRLKAALYFQHQFSA